MVDITLKYDAYCKQLYFISIINKVSLLRLTSIYQSACVILFHYSLNYSLHLESLLIYTVPFNHPVLIPCLAQRQPRYSNIIISLINNSLLLFRKVFAKNVVSILNSFLYTIFIISETDFHFCLFELYCFILIFSLVEACFLIKSV